MNKPDQNQWRALYQAAVEVKALAPWDWMAETDIFGVQDPNTNEFGFVSIMGSLGEHLSIAVYMGARNIHAFWDMLRHVEDDMADPQTLLELYHLQASFEDRAYLQPEDRKLIRSLKLKFRGRQAYPMFRAYHPARIPWFVDADEARMLTLALEQTLIVAPRLQQDPTLLDGDDEEHFLVRVQTKEGWEDQELHIPAPATPMIFPQKDAPLFEAFQKIPQRKLDLEADLFMALNHPVQDKKDERPYFPYALLILDPSQDQIVAVDLQSPIPSVEAMYSMFPVALVKQLLDAGLRPRRMKVQSLRLFGLLKPLEAELGFKVQFKKSLLVLEGAKISFLTFDSMI